MNGEAEYHSDVRLGSPDMFHCACSNQQRDGKTMFLKVQERDRQTANEWGFLCGARRASSEELP